MSDPANPPHLAEEVELKFIVPPENVAALREQLPLPQTGKRRGKQRNRLLSVYFDTPDLELRRHGIGLRVRHVGDRRLQTVKCSGSAGSCARLECEHEISSDHPDLTCVEEAGLQDVFSDIGAPDRLQPIFTTSIDRTAWEFRHGGAAIECAVDVGEIRAGSKTEPVCELELELKGGRPAGLFEAADRLTRRLSLRVEWESKGQRGYALAVGSPPEPPQRVKLRPKMTTREAAVLIVSAGLEQVAFHAPLVLQQGDAESVHRMRTAVRRLRANLTTFRKALGKRHLAFEGDLRWLQDCLGAVRDWDVFLENARPLNENGDVVVVAEAAARCRNEAYGALSEALNSSRCTSLWLAILRWLSTLNQGGSGDARLDLPIVKYARRALRRRARKLDERGRHIVDLDDAELHRLRIDAKKLRYATEAFRDLFPRRRVKRLLGPLKELQDLLGNLNDARSAHTLLGRLAPEHEAIDPAFAHGEGIIEGGVLVHARSDRGHLARRWRRYDETKKPWA